VRELRFDDPGFSVLSRTLFGFFESCAHVWLIVNDHPLLARKNWSDQLKSVLVP